MRETLCVAARYIHTSVVLIHRFHEANIKATAGGKGQAEPREDRRRKGMTNATYGTERERMGVCVYIHTRLYLFNFKIHFLSWADV